MAKNWTKAQHDALYDRGNTLLVSAAAGSGKTSVLTARIISKLTDDESHTDISKLLVVTFTRAAAEELRERISDALTEELAKNPKNKRIANQIVKLGSAKISTIHSFCYNIVRENFDILGLSAGVRIADEAEIRLLRKKIMDDVIEEYYDSSISAENIPDENRIRDFAAFSDIFVTDRDEKLADIFIALSEKLHGYPEGADFLKNFSIELEKSADNFFSSKFGHRMLDILKDEAAYFRDVFEDACRCFEENEKYAKNYLPSFEYEHDFACELIAAYESSNIWSNFSEKINSLLLSHTPIPLGRGVKKAEQTEKSDYFRSVRSEFAKRLEVITERIFWCSPEMIRKSCIVTAEVCRDIYRLEKNYELRLDEEKRRRGIIDYNDLERMTLKLLYDGDQPSQTAKELRNYYEEIYIDEYQDVNYTQDRIFSAISRDDNRFMVGDIKQSIYGFRGAAPDLFADYRESFEKYSDKKNSGGKYTIFLSDNFRCDGTIIDFSNIIFSCLFRNGSGAVPYYPEDDLICSKSDGRNQPIPVTVAVIEKGGNDNSVDDIETDSDQVCGGEAEYVADEIKKLLLNGYKAGDIAVLLRSSRNSAELFEKEFERRGINYYNAAPDDFFENAEVRLIMSLLCIVDNPMRDIYLAGTLMSPLYMFTLDELINIRAYEQSGPLYTALKKFTEDNDFYKGRYFLEKLEKYRQYSEGEPVDKLIWYIYRDSGILSFAKSGDKKKTPEAVRANLMLFYDYARRYESGSFKGLYNFIYYIEDIIAENEKLDTAKKSGESADTVKIMTIHQSKGLEFPVCFVCDTAHRLNKSDMRSNIVIDRDFGVSMMLRDSTGFTRYNTPIRQAASMNIDRKQTDEEMRILYVALTRAKKLLYVTAAIPEPEKLISECENAAGNLGVYLFQKQQCYIKWILTALASERNGGNNSSYVIKTISPSAESKSINNSEVDYRNTAAKIDCRKIEEYKKLFKKRFDFSYGYDAATKLPAKLSVSKLYPEVLDDEENSAELSLFNGGEIYGNEVDSGIKYSESDLVKPAFLLSDNSVAGVTSAERGTATHVFMQFCDFGYVEENGIEAELERQKDNGFITARMAEIVYMGQIKRFFDSALYKKIRRAELRGELYREFRFNVKLQAAEFTSQVEQKKKLENETILVQGIIDCIFKSSEGYNIVDYKTDYMPHETDADIKESEKALAERHCRQLEYYCAACEKITGEKPARIYLYSFCIGKSIEL